MDAGLPPGRCGQKPSQPCILSHYFYTIHKHTHTHTQKWVHGKKVSSPSPVKAQRPSSILILHTPGSMGGTKKGGGGAQGGGGSDWNNWNSYSLPQLQCVLQALNQERHPIRKEGMLIFLGYELESLTGPFTLAITIYTLSLRDLHRGE